jgi:hypothetical protein
MQARPAQLTQDIEAFIETVLLVSEGGASSPPITKAARYQFIENMTALHAQDLHQTAQYLRQVLVDDEVCKRVGVFATIHLLAFDRSEVRISIFAREILNVREAIFQENEEGLIEALDRCSVNSYSAVGLHQLLFNYGLEAGAERQTEFFRRVYAKQLAILTDINLKATLLKEFMVSPNAKALLPHLVDAGVLSQACEATEFSEIRTMVLQNNEYARILGPSLVCQYLQIEKSQAAEEGFILQCKAMVNVLKPFKQVEFEEVFSRMYPGEEALKGLIALQPLLLQQDNLAFYEYYANKLEQLNGALLPQVLAPLCSFSETDGPLLEKTCRLIHMMVRPGQALERMTGEKLFGLVNVLPAAAQNSFICAIFQQVDLSHKLAESVINGAREKRLTPSDFVLSTTQNRGVLLRFAYEKSIEATPGDQRLILAYFKLLIEQKREPVESTIQSMQLSVETMEVLLESDEGKELVFGCPMLAEKFEEISKEMFLTAFCNPSDAFIDATKLFSHASKTWCRIMTANQLFFPLLDRLREAEAVIALDAFEALVSAGGVTQTYGKNLEFIESLMVDSVPTIVKSSEETQDSLKRKIKVIGELCYMLPARGKQLIVGNVIQYLREMIQGEEMRECFTAGYFREMLSLREGLPGGVQTFLSFSLFLDPPLLKGSWEQRGNDVATDFILSPECLPTEKAFSEAVLPFYLNFVRLLAQTWDNENATDEVRANAQEFMRGICKALFEACTHPEQVTNLAQQLNQIRRFTAPTMFVSGHYKAAGSAGWQAFIQHREEDAREGERTLWQRTVGKAQHVRAAWNTSNPLQAMYESRLKDFEGYDRADQYAVRLDGGVSDGGGAGAGGDSSRPSSPASSVASQSMLAGPMSPSQEPLVVELSEILDGMIKTRSFDALNEELVKRLRLSANNKTDDLTLLIKKILLNPMLAERLNVHAAYFLLGYIDDKFVFSPTRELLLAKRLHCVIHNPVLCEEVYLGLQKYQEGEDRGYSPDRISVVSDLTVALLESEEPRYAAFRHCYFQLKQRNQGHLLPAFIKHLFNSPHPEIFVPYLLKFNHIRSADDTFIYGEIGKNERVARAFGLTQILLILGRHPEFVAQEDEGNEYVRQCKAFLAAVKGEGNLDEAFAPFVAELPGTALLSLFPVVEALELLDDEQELLKLCGGETQEVAEMQAAPLKLNPWYIQRISMLLPEQRVAFFNQLVSLYSSEKSSAIIKTIVSAEMLRDIPVESLFHALCCHENSALYVEICMQDHALKKQLLQYCWDRRPEYLMREGMTRNGYCAYLQKTFKVAGDTIAQAVLQDNIGSLSEEETDRLLLLSAELNIPVLAGIAALQPTLRGLHRLLWGKGGVIFCLRHQAQCVEWDPRFPTLLLDALRDPSNELLGQIAKEKLGAPELWVQIMARHSASMLIDRLLAHALIDEIEAVKAMVRDQVREEKHDREKLLDLFLVAAQKLQGNLPAVEDSAQAAVEEGVVVALGQGSDVESDRQAYLQFLVLISLFEGTCFPIYFRPGSSWESLIKQKPIALRTTEALHDCFSFDFMKEWITTPGLSVKFKGGFVLNVYYFNYILTNGAAQTDYWSKLGKLLAQEVMVAPTKNGAKPMDLSFLNDIASRFGVAVNLYGSYVAGSFSVHDFNHKDYRNIHAFSRGMMDALFAVKETPEEVSSLYDKLKAIRLKLGDKDRDNVFFESAHIPKAALHLAKGLFTHRDRTEEDKSKEEGNVAKRCAGHLQAAFTRGEHDPIAAARDARLGELRRQTMAASPKAVEGGGVALGGHWGERGGGAAGGGGGAGANGDEMLSSPR